MKKLFKFTGTFFYYFVLATLMFSTTAHAYIDPAATSYLLQIVAGAVITCSVVVGVFWKKIRLFFRDQKIKHLEKKLTKKAEKKS